MSKPPRDRTSFGSNVYFVTASAWRQCFLFQSERMTRLRIDTLFHYRRERKYLVHEFVIMPNHIHLMIAPTGVTLERALHLIKGGFSYRVKKDLHLNMEIWQRGYVDHRIRDADDYTNHAAYVRQNPVQSRLVALAEDYPYSSAGRGFDLDPCPQGLKPEVVKFA